MDESVAAFQVALRAFVESGKVYGKRMMASRRKLALHHFDALLVESAKDAYARELGLNAEEEVIKLPSGLEEAGVLEMCLDAGMTAYEKSPEDRDAIQDQIAKLLQGLLELLA